MLNISEQNVLVWSKPGFSVLRRSLALFFFSILYFIFLNCDLILIVTATLRALHES